MKIKVSELSGAALDWAVAKADGTLAYITLDHSLTHPLILSGVQSYGPSFIWSQGGPIIERERINIEPFEDINGKQWSADRCWDSPTPLIAAMRCYVARKLGIEVDIPKELV